MLAVRATSTLKKSVNRKFQEKISLNEICCIAFQEIPWSHLSATSFAFSMDAKLAATTILAETSDSVVRANAGAPAFLTTVLYTIVRT